MNATARLEQFYNASYVTKSTLFQVYGISENALSENIKRWLKKGLLIQLKKGVYVTSEFYRSVSNRQTYIEFVANILKIPSYLSTEYVLQKYSMLTESVFTVTSVSRKKTRQYHNALGTFQYATIKEKLFTGFDTIERDGLLVRQATKAKALFDFLYFRLWRSSDINKSLIESYRLNLVEFSKHDLAEFEGYIKRSEIKKFFSMTDIIRELIDDLSDANTCKASPREHNIVSMNKVNIKEQLSELLKLWSPKVIAQLNDYEVRIAQVQGDYHWHHHLHSDELFMVVEGELRIEFRDRSVLLKEGELLVVPKATEHKPFAEKLCRILLIESSDTIPTGDEDEKNILEISK